MNLDYTIENNRFNARVAAIIYNKDKSKVLLFKMIDKDYYMLPGGRIEFNEDSISAVKREIKEETEFDLEYKFISIQENFVTRNNINIMQYCFVYEAIYEEDIKHNEFICKDNDYHKFYWIDIDKINNIIIFPESTKNMILKENDIVLHIIEKA